MRRWRHSFCALILLGAAVAGCGHPVDPSVVDPFEVLRDKLGQTVTVDWEGVPLETALRELGERQGVAIHLDRLALEAGGASPVERVTLHVHGIRLRSVLHLLCDDTDRAFQLQEDGIWVTSRTVADNALVGRLYNVADLTRDQKSFDEDALAEVIKEIVATDRWENVGGSGTIDVRPGALLVKQTYDIHLQIADLLDELRAGTGDADAPSAGGAGPTAAILHALDARVSIDLNRAPAEVLHEIQTRHGINVVVRWRKQAEAEDIAARLHAAPHASPAPMVLTDVTLRTALDLLLEPLGLGWTVRSDVLMVTPRDYADTSLSARTYRLPAGINAQRTEWRTTPSIGDLGTFYPGSTTLTNVFTDKLTSLTRPDSWRDAGGAGIVCPVPARIVVAQTQRVHGELAAWLDQVRRASDPRVLDYDERATSPQAERLWRALEQPVTVKFLENQYTLRQALDQFVKHHGLPNVFIDDRDYDADQHYPQLDVQNVSLAAALDRLLDPIGQGWYVRDNVLVVTSKDVADSTIVNLTYRCPCLASGDAETMIDLVKNFVRPDSWKDAGGPGWGLWVFGNVLSVSQTCSGHREVRRFLRQWEAVHDTAPGGPPRMVASPAEQRVYAALDKRISVFCEDRPLTAVVAELARQAGLGDVEWDWKRIADYTDYTTKDIVEDLRDGKLRATIHAADEPANETLTRLLRPHGLSWVIANHGLSVTSNDASATRLVTGFYKLPACLAPSSGRENTLIDLIKAHVDPMSWKDTGGFADVDLVSGNILIVSHSWPMHARVRLFLRQLDAALAPPATAPRLVLSVTEQRYYDRLQQPVTCAGKDQPLLTAIAQLAKQGRIESVVWDWDSIRRPEPSALADELRSGKRRVTIEAAGEPLGSVLTRVLRPHHLWWTISKDALLVSSVRDEQPLVTGFYRVPTEALATLRPHIPPAAGDPPDLAEQCLLDLVKEACEPDTWSDNGGPGELQLFSPAGGKSWIVVSNRLVVHPSVGQFLDDLRQRRKLTDELLEKLKDIQESNREQAKTPRPSNSPSGGGLFSVTSKPVMSTAGSKP